VDSLKLIPSVFFDLIARVVPGISAIVGAVLLFKTSWSEVLEQTLGPPFASPDSQFTSMLLLFFFGYISGQIIAPLAKYAQRIGEKSMFGEKQKARAGGYDYLRLHHETAGSQCAKIRAEFTMFNGLATVFFLGAFIYLTQVFRQTLEFEILVLLGLVAATIGCAIRGKKTRDTFNETVEKFLNSAARTEPPPPQEDPRVSPGRPQV